MVQSRLEKLSLLLETNNLYGTVLNPGASLTYLTGLDFHLMERPVLFFFLPGKTPVMVLPELEKAKLEEIPFKIIPFFYSDISGEKSAAISKAVGSLNLEGKHLAVEPTRMRFLELEHLKGAEPTVEFMGGSSIFDNLRIKKDGDEIAAMQKAANIAQEAFMALLPEIQPGKTELQMANILTINLFKLGSDPQLPFQVIFSSGPNSANPHAVPGDRVLKKGDIVVVDWGAACHGYASDLTRTLVLGEPSWQQGKIAEIVLQANKAGRNSSYPGILAGDVDKASRSIIEAAGFGQYFTHRTGHGLGMEAHETPYIFEDNSVLLEPGMVYTVEPGIYLPGQFGVRIEDDVVITREGAHSLTDLPRELFVIS